MNRLIFICLAIGLSITVPAQQDTKWSEDDRKYLIEKLTASIENIKKEANGLTEAQWNFKPNANLWSISEIIEHIAIWELLLLREVSMDLKAGPAGADNISAKPDSVYYNFIMETRPHITNESTKPFTFAQPMGHNKGSDNLLWLEKMRKEGIEFVATTREDLRAFYLKPGRGNIHQVFITLFGHADRHLRQILKNKADPNFPR